MMTREPLYTPGKTGRYHRCLLLNKQLIFSRYLTIKDTVMLQARLVFSLYSRQLRLSCGALLICGWSSASLAETFVLPPQDSDVVGEVHVIKARYEDTLSDIARRYNVGYNEIVLANPGVDPWLPGEGREINLPTQYVLPNAPREGVVVNIPEMRLYYYPKIQPGQKAVVVTYPISVGKMDWNTPLGVTKITAKTEKPSWTPPESIRKEHADRGDFLPKVVAPGAGNPLGKHALRLGLGSYLIHGTNNPYGVGMRVTHGCVRLYPEDIAQLFERVAIGTNVHFVNQPYKAGWRDGVLYIESHPPLEEELAGYTVSRTPVIKAILSVESREGAVVDWSKTMQVAEARNGVPTAISSRANDVVALSFVGK